MDRECKVLQPEEDQSNCSGGGLVENRERTAEGDGAGEDNWHGVLFKKLTNLKKGKMPSQMAAKAVRRKRIRKRNHTDGLMEAGNLSVAKCRVQIMKEELLLVKEMIRLHQAIKELILRILQPTGDVGRQSHGERLTRLGWQWLHHSDAEEDVYQHAGQGHQPWCLGLSRRSWDVKHAGKNEVWIKYSQ
jgi:hypothetical protein